MTIRSLDFLDLPFLPRYRQDILSLDSARWLTHGNPLSTSALLSYLDPRRNIYTALINEDENTLMGQIVLREAETSARLTFLSPAKKIDGMALALLDHLTRQAGEWGALHVLAEVNEENPVFQTLRQAGFAMYAWQRIWKLPNLGGDAGQSHWREAQDSDWPSVQSLHAQIVPALLQPVDQLPRQVMGVVCTAGNGLQAYAMFTSGPEGIWLQMIVPPDSSCSTAQVQELVQTIGGGNKKTVHVCVRSYQAWLETALDDLHAEAGPRQAVMVRRLAIPIKEMQALPAMEKALAKAKPAAPVARTTTRDSNHDEAVAPNGT
jgi:hypothetical protein